MLHTFFTALSWALGSFGVAGTVALIAAVIFLGPAATLAIVEPVLAKFFACTKCVALAAAVIATVGAYWVGIVQERDVCREEIRASREAAEAADTDASRHAQADAALRTASIQQSADEQHRRDLDEIEALKARPSPACTFDDGDTGSLRHAGPGGADAAGSAAASNATGQRAKPRSRLRLPLVWHRRLQGQGRAGDAAPHQ